MPETTPLSVHEPSGDPKGGLVVIQEAFGVNDHIEDVCRRMEEQRVSRAELARRMGTSRAYVTKLLDGSANFTLTTMVKVAMALGGALHLHIADQHAATRWYDEVPKEQDEAVAVRPTAVAGVGR